MHFSKSRCVKLLQFITAQVKLLQFITAQVKLLQFITAQVKLLQFITAQVKLLQFITAQMGAAAAASLCVSAHARQAATLTCGAWPPTAAQDLASMLLMLLMLLLLLLLLLLPPPSAFPSLQPAVRYAAKALTPRSERNFSSSPSVTPQTRIITAFWYQRLTSVFQGAGLRAHTPSLGMQRISNCKVETLRV